MEDKFQLTKKGLACLKQLSKTTYSSLMKDENEIINCFLDANLRIIEFQLVNEPPLDEILEDKIKKEIFSRYNTGITPLKKGEVENAKYDKDELSNGFKLFLRENQNFRKKITETFFKKRKNLVEVPEVDIMSFIRKFLVLPQYPIKYYASGHSRPDVLNKLYEFFSNTNRDSLDSIINNFEKKIIFLFKVKEYSLLNNLNFNRLAFECFLWVLGIIEIEEKNIKLNDDLVQKISNFISTNIEYYKELDHGFQKEVLERFTQTAQFLTEINIDIDIYLYVSKDSKRRLKDLLVPNNTSTKLNELEIMRLNKPEPTRKNIDDICRLMNRGRFLIRPSYQRKEVINLQKASAIIESILLGITLPAIFIFKRDDEVLEVIDGQQRLLTILGFIGEGYNDVNNKNQVSEKHAFKLRNLKVLTELNGLSYKNENFSDVNREKIMDFKLYLVEINQRQNQNFDPIDLFIRLNDKPYPIKTNSFEMWNSWVDNDIIKGVKDIRLKYKDWFYLRPLKRKADRDRMENEELITSIMYLFYYNHSSPKKYYELYQKEERINARVNKSYINNLLYQAKTDENIKKNIFHALKQTKQFIVKLKIILLDCDKNESELSEYLSSELNEILKANRQSRSFKRNRQDFIFLWLLLGEINLEMVKYHRLKIKSQIRNIFHYIKNIPASDFENNLGLSNFKSTVIQMQNAYKTDSRKIRLSESQKAELIEKQNHSSSISSAPIFLGDDLEADHAKPISIGGKDEISNIGLAHKDENRSKGNNYEGLSKHD